MGQIDLRRLLNGGMDRLETGKKPENSAVVGTSLARLDAEDAINQPNWLPHGPLRNINFRRITSKRTLMEELNKTIIFNQHVDLPDFIYRPDLLDPQFFAVLAEDHDEDRAFAAQSMLDASIVTFDFNEGYPTLNTTPIWHQLPFESEEAHRAFGLYCEQEGARSIGGMIAFDQEQLKDWFHEYVWLHRARAFDMFKVVHHQRLRVSRVMNLENTHHGIADGLIAALQNYLKTPDWINWDELKDPLKLAKFFETMTKIQRTSAGLAALGGGGKDGNEIPQVPSVEVIMRKVSPKNEERTDEVDHLDLLRENPDAIEMAQELIISVNRNGRRQV